MIILVYKYLTHVYEEQKTFVRWDEQKALDKFAEACYFIYRHCIASFVDVGTGGTVRRPCVAGIREDKSSSLSSLLLFSPLVSTNP